MCLRGAGIRSEGPPAPVGRCTSLDVLPSSALFPPWKGAVCPQRQSLSSGLSFPASSSCVCPSAPWFQSTVWFDSPIHQPLVLFFTLISLLKVLVDPSDYLINLNINNLHSPVPLPQLSASSLVPTNLPLTQGLKIRVTSYLSPSPAFTLFQSLVPSSFEIFQLVPSPSSPPLPISIGPFLGLSVLCLETGFNVPF